MALNYSQWPMFPAHISEDNLVSPMRRIGNGCLMDDIPNMNGDGYLRPWHMMPGEAEEQNFNYGRDRATVYSSQESTSDDIADLLPSDPFGMDIETTFTAISGWLEDLEIGYGGYMRTNSYGDTQEGSHSLFAGWNTICNNSLKFQLFPNTFPVNEKLNVGSFPSSFEVYENPCVGRTYITGSVMPHEKMKAASMVEERGMVVGLAPVDNGFQQSHNLGDDARFSNGSASCSSELGFAEKVESAANFEEMPHEAIGYALCHLGVKDLLSVEMVCKSLLSTVRGDPLLWRTIHIDPPLNERITDDVLVQLVTRAQGTLQCLSLVECPKITDHGLRRILETNQGLTELCVPGCTRISIEGIVNIIKAYNSNRHIGGIKRLRIGGLYGVNHEHFEELKSSLGVDDMKLGSDHKPHFYHRGNFYLPYDDDRSIDIEMCPICGKFRLVYDCPAEGCKVKDKSPHVCRACTFCIPRCGQCGRCINDTEFVETFCLELLCSGCFLQTQKDHDHQDKRVDPFGVVHAPSDHVSHHG